MEQMWPLHTVHLESALVLENELNSLGIKAKGYQSNAADFDEAQTMVDAVLADFGTVDILINNAGITKDNLFAYVRQILTR
jgi:3-oxoacyl-[acyl-carrier protein] reductase